MDVGVDRRIAGKREQQFLRRDLVYHHGIRLLDCPRCGRRNEGGAQDRSRNPRRLGRYVLGDVPAAELTRRRRLARAQHRGHARGEDDFLDDAFRHPISSHATVLTARPGPRTSSDRDGTVSVRRMLRCPPAPRPVQPRPPCRALRGEMLLECAHSRESAQEPSDVGFGLAIVSMIWLLRCRIRARFDVETSAGRPSTSGPVGFASGSHRCRHGGDMNRSLTQSG